MANSADRAPCYQGSVAQAQDWITDRADDKAKLFVVTDDVLPRLDLLEELGNERGPSVTSVSRS